MKNRFSGKNEILYEVPRTMYQDPSEARGEKQEPRLDAAGQKSLLLTKD